MQKINLLVHTFLELLESSHLIVQEKVSQAAPEPSRKTKLICWV